MFGYNCTTSIENAVPAYNCTGKDEYLKHNLKEIEKHQQIIVDCDSL